MDCRKCNGKTAVIRTVKLSGLVLRIRQCKACGRISSTKEEETPSMTMESVESASPGLGVQG